MDLEPKRLAARIGGHSFSFRTMMQAEDETLDTTANNKDKKKAPKGIDEYYSTWLKNRTKILRNYKTFASGSHSLDWLKKPCVRALMELDTKTGPALSKIDAKINERRPSCYEGTSLEDFVPLHKMGKGAYGCVPICKNKKSGLYCRIKFISKKRLVDEGGKKSKYWLEAIFERDFMKDARSPHIVTYLGSFKDNCNIFFIMENQDFGDLDTVQSRRCKNRVFKTRATVFFSAQILAALEYVHAKKACYRDLKPENVMMDYQAYVKLGDFGFCKTLPSSGKHYTSLGTYEFMAPELFGAKGTNYAVDWWAFGVLVFTLVCGFCPFGDTRHVNSRVIINNILHINYTIPKKDVMGKALTLDGHVIDLLADRLLVPQERRFQSAKQVKKHPLFVNVNWDALAKRTVKAPFKPGSSKPKQEEIDWYHEDIGLPTSSREEYAQEFEGF